MENWVTPWFNADYLKLYPHRNQVEAEKEMAFVVESIQPTRNSCFLDVGCGTGRHAIALAKLGYQVKGIDSSEFLLSQARLDPAWPISLDLADITNLQLDEQYDHVLSMFTSFGYCDSDEENRRVLKKMVAPLKPGGTFFLDYLNPFWVEKGLIPREERNVEGKEVVIERRVEGDQVIKTITFPDQVYQERVKLYSLEQLKEMMSEVGLTPLKSWGDFDGCSWSSHSPRQLVLAAKPFLY